MSDMPWSSALCFLLAGVVIFCVLFLAWDSWRQGSEQRAIRRKYQAHDSSFCVGRDVYRFIKGVHR